MTVLTDRLHPPAAIALLDLRPLIAYLAAALLLIAPLVFQGPAEQASAEVVSAQIDDGRGGWAPADLTALKPAQGRVSTLKLRLRVDPRVAASGEPLGLYLSGSYSAEVFWNGAPIGAKGRPGATREAETPGLVDAVLPLPAQLVRPGQNELTLRLSSSHLTHSIHSVIHGQGGLFGLRVAPFSAEARRPIGYYAAPFLMSPVLLLALAALALRGEARSAGGLILVGLLTAALAEMARSVINYPYSLHDLRMVSVALAAKIAAVGIVLHAGKAAGPPGRRVAALLAALTVVASLGLQDHQTLVLAAGAGTALGAWGVLRRHQGAIELTVALALMTALAALDFGEFMDRGLYAAAAALVACLIWPRRMPAAPHTQAAPERLAVGPADARRIIALADIRAIHGAGDYVELRLASGERLLHLETLQALAARLPERFLRTHRSHIVNLDGVEALKTAGGGRYAVRLDCGAHVPVSRTRLAELRQRLGA